MATTNVIQHPRHDQHHPLEHRDFSKDSIHPPCHLCKWKISADGYACLECRFYVHRVCAEAPPRIDSHPLHPQHPLTLIHRPPPIGCDACGNHLTFIVTSYRCDECDFNLDIRCTLSTVSDQGGTQGETLEQIKLPFHPHTLTSFSTRHEFVGDGDCVICKASVEGDGYMCLHHECNFFIHKRCIQDLYYTDGTKAPQVYHGHPMETFLGEGTGSSICGKCRSEKLGEFIGCVSCQVFYCRDCVQVPEIIQYPHHPDHTLVLLMECPENDKPRCVSCTSFCKGEFCYGCPSCEFFVDMTCALQVLSYCEEGTKTEIKLPWHEHLLRLCHRTKYGRHHCSYCEDKSSGPMYACSEKGCQLLLHKQCTKIEPTIIHPHHLDHSLTLRELTDFRSCGACGVAILYLGFSCELCEFYLHSKCATHFPTQKHSLHEHGLLHLDKASFWKCNRCGTYLSSSLLRCVPCNFNLHEECIKLPPQVVNSEVHWHPLTLHEIYIEDDSGEYYCDHCEQKRDERIGAYVCLQCSAKWAYHIDCVFPELREIYVKEHNAAEIKRLAGDIREREEEVQAVERKLKEMQRELDEQKKKHAALTVQ